MPAPFGSPSSAKPQQLEGWGAWLHQSRDETRRAFGTTDDGLPVGCLWHANAPMHAGTIAGKHTTTSIEMPKETTTMNLFSQMADNAAESASGADGSIGVLLKVKGVLVYVDVLPDRRARVYAWNASERFIATVLDAPPLVDPDDEA